jgi:hypothetical protein
MIEIENQPKPLLLLRAKRAALEKEMRMFMCWSIEREDECINAIVTMSDDAYGWINKLKASFFDEEQYSALECLKNFVAACKAVGRVECALVPNPPDWLLRRIKD